ncbi:hypothetical protein [Streptomyces microflavus]|uniref:hypothetical protein n=1 Tax=Streptomyces microflavus TaxID=1919 RepID=UPI0036D13122
MIAAIIIVGALAYAAGALLYARHRWAKTEAARRRDTDDGQWHEQFCDRRFVRTYVFGRHVSASMHTLRCDCAGRLLWIVWPLVLLAVPVIAGWNWTKPRAHRLWDRAVHPEVEVPDRGRISSMEKELL